MIYSVHVAVKIEDFTNESVQLSVVFLYIPTGSRYHVVSPYSCLEKSTTYTVRLDFNRYQRGRVTPEASLLIDSVSAHSKKLHAKIRPD